MQIVTFLLGELQTNCYLVFDPETKEGIVIDPADDANFISEQILQKNIILKYIVATHGHFDHLLASYELSLAFNLPVLINANDLLIVKYLAKSAAWWLKREIIEKPPENLHFIKEGDLIKFGKDSLKVIETPGHTPGGLCLYSAKQKVLFTGDTLFSNTIGRTDLPYSSEDNLKKSLKKLSKLDPKTKIYPGHGDLESLDKALNEINVFFQ